MSQHLCLHPAPQTHPDSHPCLRPPTSMPALLYLPLQRSGSSPLAQPGFISLMLTAVDSSSTAGCWAQLLADAFNSFSRECLWHQHALACACTNMQGGWGLCEQGVEGWVCRHRGYMEYTCMGACGNAECTHLPSGRGWQGTLDCTRTLLVPAAPTNWPASHIAQPLLVCVNRESA